MTRLVLAIMVPTGFLAAVALGRVTQLEVERANENARQSAISLSRSVDREIDGVIATLTGLATSPALDSNDFERLYKQAEIVAARIKAPILVREEKTGQQIINTRRSFGTELSKSQPGTIPSDWEKKRAPFVTQIITGAVARSPVIAIVVPVPFDPARTEQLLVVASIDPARINDVLIDEGLSDGWIGAILDRSGRVFARSDKHDEFFGKTLRAGTSVDDQPITTAKLERALAPDGQVVLRGYQSSKYGLTAVASLPEAAIYEPLYRTWLVFSALVLASAALAVPLATGFAGRISDGFRIVALEAERLAKVETVLPVPTGVAEATEVLQKLHATSRSLRDRTRALAESAARFRSTFEQAAVGFEQIDLGGRWVMLNTRFCDILGYSRDECMALTPDQLTHPDDLAVEKPLIDSVLRGSIPSASLEKRYRNKSGDYVWVRASTSLVHDVDGYPLYFVSVVEDISAVDAGRTATATLAAIVQASNDPIISLDRNATVRSWNPAAEQLLGCASALAIGRDVSILVAGQDPTYVTEMFLRGLAGESYRLDTEFTTLAGEPISVSVAVAPIRAHDGSVTSVSLTAEDIRERKRWEERQQLMNREMHHRIKNSLAVVQSLANQTMRTSAGLKEFREVFAGRLQALAVANDVFVEAAWTASSLQRAVEKQLSPLRPQWSDALITSGPEVMLPGDLTVPVSLALHELGTNAVKYGVWSAPPGRVELTWTSEANASGPPILHLDWRELGGKSLPLAEGVAWPARQGFGTTLIRRGIPGAVVDLSMTPDGLACRFKIPLRPPQRAA